MSSYTVNLSWRGILEIVGFILVIGFLFMIRDVVILCIIAFILSSGFMAGAHFITGRTPFTYQWSVVIVMIGVIIGLIGLFMLIIPPISQEVASLVRNFPRLLDQLDIVLTSFLPISRGSLSELVLGNYDLTGFVTEAVSGIFFTTQGVIANIFYTGFVLLSAFLMAFDPQSLEKLVLMFFPKYRRKKARIILTKARIKLGHWLVGQMIVAIILASISYIGLLILGVPYALLLAVVAGVLNMIPFIGPILGLIPALFFGILQSLQTAALVLLLYVVIQNLEGNVLTPIIMNKVTGLSTITILLAIILGASLAGALGALIAIPLLSVISLFVTGLDTKSSNQ